MSEEQEQTVICSLCFKEHSTTTLYGITIIPCPDMPEDLIMPSSTLEAFIAGRSMLDQPFIVTI